MKNTTRAVLVALAMFDMQESAAFVWCDHSALCYAEDVSESGFEEVYNLLEPLDIGSGNISF